MKTLRLLVCLLALSLLHQAYAGNKIKYYFNHTCDNSVAVRELAKNINGSIDDTLVAYINRAKYTIDVAVYNFTYSSSMSGIITAINNAYSRGIKIRWIKDGGSTNSGVSSISSGIPVLASPTSSSYTIMHNKFMLIDAKSSDPNDAIVWTGSTNWSYTQFDVDYDNIVVVQDSALAHAYLNHFNMMWGDTGMVYNTTTSKFGSRKTDLGQHNFIIDGKQVELYFSPADNTNAKIINAINSANKDLYFGMYTFTYNSNASAIVAKHNSGVYVSGIVDDFNGPGNSAYDLLIANLPGSKFKVFTGSTLYHNKYLIVDPSDSCSDPLVLTGSHNWSVSANTDNDENTLIIHDYEAANVYYQSFKADFGILGGTLTRINGCTTGVEDIAGNSPLCAIAPNPTNGDFSIQITGNYAPLSIAIYSIDGRLVDQVTTSENKYTWNASIAIPGIYQVVCTGSQVHQVQKVVVY